MKLHPATSRFCTLLTLTGVAQATSCRIVVTLGNLAPHNGASRTPYWISFLDGAFDIYSGGTTTDNDPLSTNLRMSVERLAATKQRLRHDYPCSGMMSFIRFDPNPGSSLDMRSADTHAPPRMIER